MTTKIRTTIAVFLAAFCFAVVAESVKPAASQAWPRPYGPVLKARCDELAREILATIPIASSIHPARREAGQRRLQELASEWDRLGCSRVLTIHRPVATHEITAAN